MTTTLHINAQAFSLDADQDTRELRAELLAGSRESAYVHFSTHGHGDVSVLMSPGMSVRFEVGAVPMTASPAEVSCAQQDQFFDFWPGDLECQGPLVA